MSQMPQPGQPQDPTIPLNPQEISASTQGNYQTYSPQADPYALQPQGKSSGGKTLAIALIAALVGGGIGGGVVAMTSQTPSASLSSSQSQSIVVNRSDSVNQITAAAAKALDSSVSLAVTASGSSASGSGSGVIIDNQGHILTNNHVVTLDGATSRASIEVRLADGSVRAARIVGTDPSSDLAVIKLEDTSGLKLVPIELGDSSQLNVGDSTIAIGAPLGLENTVTTGIVSNLQRTIEVSSSEAQDSDSSDSFGSSPFQFQIPGQNQNSTSRANISLNVIQTDAAINPGNSGGALVNSEGKLIGINVAIASTESSSNSTSGNIGVGFAIPINYASRVAQEIIDKGSASHGLLGASVTTSPANNDSSQSFGDGALVREVTRGGAAEQAGIRSGDVITALNGRPIQEAGQLTAAVRQQASGSKVSLTIQREGQEQTLEVTLGQAQ